MLQPLEPLARDRDGQIEAAGRRADRSQVEHAQKELEVGDAVHDSQRNRETESSCAWFYHTIVLRSVRSSFDQEERAMEYRVLGASGFKVPVLGFGAGTFGGKGPLFSAWGKTDVAEAKRLIDLCLDAGANFFDTADVYSDGASEAILGAALAGKRERAIISTKIGLRAGAGVNDVGASRSHLIRGVDRALERLRTDYIDVLQLHQFDALTPVESVMSTLDDLVKAGKVRFVGASNYAGWQLMKSLAAADRYGYARFVAHQAYY